MLKFVTVNNVTFEVEFEGTPFVPAQTSGPPEDCYPAEGGEADIISVYLNLHELTEMLNEGTLELIRQDLVEYLCSDSLVSDEEGDRADHEYEQEREEALCRR